MGFHSTLTSHDCVVWPEWFKHKYDKSIVLDHKHLFCPDPNKYSHLNGVQRNGWEFRDIHTDIQKAINWKEYGDNDPKASFTFIYLHDCGGVTRCVVSKDDIVWTEPIHWKRVTRPTHDDLCTSKDICREDIDYDARGCPSDLAEDDEYVSGNHDDAVEAVHRSFEALKNRLGRVTEDEGNEVWTTKQQ